MIPKETNGRVEQPKNPQAENQKGIENHKKAAAHFQAAAKSHLEAATHHENQNHDLAAKSMVEALGFSNRARKAQRADIKLHTAKI
jgi:hypothetical protein